MEDSDVPTPTKLGRLIRELREERGWTQEETSRRSGVSRNLIASIESGQRGELLLGNAVKLCRAFRISLDHLADVWKDEESEKWAATV
jgi:transcriptional regulator with XRE-family HTH domain